MAAISRFFKNSIVNIIYLILFLGVLALLLFIGLAILGGLVYGLAFFFGDTTMGQEVWANHGGKISFGLFIAFIAIVCIIVSILLPPS